LLLTDIPRPSQKSLRLEDQEIVIFTELHSQSFSYRDALLLPNGTRVLQDLPPRIHATVLGVSPDSLIEDLPLAVRAA
jgi:hypothetical protein